MIEIRQLNKRINGEPLYRDLDLEIPEGKISVILGKSGVGKSVLLKHVLGLQLPDAGQILVEGTDITRLDEHQRRENRLNFGMVFQHSALLDSLTVAENVSLGLRKLTGRSVRSIQSRVEECLRAVELAHTAEMLPAQLSGGMRKRVAFARAIAMKPRYLLYDEPTSGLDPVTGEIIGDLILQFKSELETTSLVVTHDVALALNIADLIGILDNGKIRTIVSPVEFHRSDHPLIRMFRESLYIEQE